MILMKLIREKKSTASAQAEFEFISKGAIGKTARFVL